MAGCTIPGPLCVTKSEPNDSGTLSLQRTPDAGTVSPVAHIMQLAKAAASDWSDGTTVAHYRNVLKLGALPDVFRDDPPRGGLRLKGSRTVECFDFNPNTRSLNLTWFAVHEEFAQYATPFELDFSVLGGRTHSAIPVVVSTSDNTFSTVELTIAGHILTLSGGQFFVANGVSCGINVDKEWARGVPIFIARDPTLHGDREESKADLPWTRVGLSEMSYTVMTRVDGAIVSFLSSGATGFAVSEFGPILFIGSLLAPLGIALFRSAIASLFVRQTASQLVLEGTTKGELQVLAREMLAKQVPGRAVVNLGGTGEVAGAINVNPLLDQQVVGVPNLVRTTAENVGEVFPAQSVDSVVSNNVVNGQVNWAAAARGSFKILRPGGSISVAPYAGQLDAQVVAIKAALEASGFRQIGVIGGKIVTAIK